MLIISYIYHKFIQISFNSIKNKDLKAIKSKILFYYLKKLLSLNFFSII